MGLIKFKVGDIQRKRALRTEDVLVPEWAPEELSAEDAQRYAVTVRAMTGRERDAFESSMIQGEGKKRKPDTVNLRARLVARCIVAEPGEVPPNEVQLGEMDGAGLDRVFTVCQRLAGLSVADVEELEKNSAPGPNGSSPSISASPSDSHTPTNSSTT